MKMSADKEKALDLLQDLKTKVHDVIDHITAQLQKAEQGDCNTAKGVSFLEVKYHNLLSYLINLTQLMCSKVKGQSIQGHPAVNRLVEIRTVMEKMRPIDQKLKYQIDKLLKTAATGTIGEGDPLRFKPNPENLQSKFDEADDSDDNDSDKSTEDVSQVYKPPKLVAMHYEDDTGAEKKKLAVSRAHKRALSSSIMQDLRDEYDEGPSEIRESADIHRMKEDKSGKERTEYEEKYFMRMAVSKKELNAAKKLRTMSELNSLTRFGDISALEHDTATGEDFPGKKRKRASSKGKKNSKASKKYKRRK